MRKVTDVVTCSHTAGALRRPDTQQVKGLNRKWRWKPRHGLQAQILPYPVSKQPWPFCVCVVGRERGWHRFVTFSALHWQPPTFDLSIEVKYLSFGVGDLCENLSLAG